MANIKNFITSFKDTELARPCNFDVTIVPTGLDFYGALLLASAKAFKNPMSIPERVSLRCEAAELPSRTFSLIEQKTYGPLKPFPIQTTYSRMNLTFICSDDMFEKWLFDAWLNYISNATFFPFPGSPGEIIDMITSGGRPLVNYDFQYKNNYECMVIITQYGVDGKPKLYSALFHAFPISVNELPLSWSNGNAIHKLSVTFAYTYHNTAVSIGDSGIPAF